MRLRILRSPKGEKMIVPLIRNVYVCRENAGFLIIIFVASFFATPNAFINPTLCVFWWAIVLLGLNSIWEDNRQPKKSRAQLEVLLSKKDTTIEGLKSINKSLLIRIVRIRTESR